LAVADLADAYAPAALVRLKWPNDVLIEGRKAAGMLIESGSAPEGGLWLAVGIGVNLASYPTDVERPATALAEHLRHDVIRAPAPDQALSDLARAFARWLDIWLSQGFEPVRAAWTARAAGIGVACTARLADQTLEGTAEGLDADGALLLRLPHGEIRRITAGDVFFGAS